MLARGYAWLEDDAGQPVRSALGLQATERVDVVLADGRLRTRIEQVLSPDPQGLGGVPTIGASEKPDSP